MPDLGSDQTTPAPVSPLSPAGPATDDEGGVVIEDLCLLTKVTVRAAAASAVAATLGVRFGRAAWHGEILRVGAGPDEWLLLGPPRSSALLADTRQALVEVPGLVSVLDVSHGRGLVRVRGPQVLDLLARLTAFDLDDRFVPDGAAFRTSVASVVTDVVRDDRGGPSYLLHCERSSARWLVDSFLAAGADFGATLVDGAWAPPA